MNQHPYLRAYMAGIALPTVLLLVVLTFVCIWRFGMMVSAPVERVIIFPMAVVPNIFGLWNMVFLKLHKHWRVPIGLHGALLPFLLAPCGFAFATAFGFLELAPHGLSYFGGLIYIPYSVLIFAPFIGLTAYYLAWKYIVGFLNRVLGIAY